MNGRVEHLAIESIAAQSEKFTAPLVFVHGLWCTGLMWRPFMGYMAHRGWSCTALHLRGRMRSGIGAQLGQTTFADYREDLAALIAACDSPPVLVGHDCGALLALHCADRARAVVALAPLIPASVPGAPLPALSGWRCRFAAWRKVPVPPPGGPLRSRYFGRGVPGDTVFDSGTVMRELCDVHFRMPDVGSVPAVVVAGERDTVSPPMKARQVAQQVGASSMVLPGAGHALPWEDGWEDCVSRVHRWIIQAVGEPLLAFRDESEEDIEG